MVIWLNDKKIFNIFARKQNIEMTRARNTVSRACDIITLLLIYKVRNLIYGMSKKEWTIQIMELSQSGLGSERDIDRKILDKLR